MSRVGCIDVGGTAIKFGVLDGGTLSETSQAPTGEDGVIVVERVLDRAAAQVERMRETGPLAAVGLVVPGVVDTATGVGLWSENLGWRDVPFRDALQERIGLPVAFGHDVRAGALAEASLGAGFHARRVVVVAVGTGIAAGAILDGTLDDPDRPSGEIGHVDVGTGLACVCGLTGCLETISSAAAVARRYTEAAGLPATAAEVAAAVERGDPVAREVWDGAVDGLARALAWVVAIQAPDAIVIGGGLARSGELLLAPLRATLERRLSFHHRPQVVQSRFGELAGCVGAGLLAQRLVTERA